jgi:hypothetical protein
VFGRFLGKKYLFSLHGCFDQKVSIWTCTKWASSEFRPHQWIYSGLQWL